MIKRFCGAVTPRIGLMMLCLVDERGTVPGAVRDAWRWGCPGAAERHSGPLLRAALVATPVGTKGWPPRSNKGMGRSAGVPHAASATSRVAWFGSNRVRFVSMAQATASSRSATLRNARPWL